MEINYFNYIVLPLLVFLARVLDVSIGTVRVIFVSKGLKTLAPILGFFEVLVWIVVVSKLMSNSVHPILYIAYAAGFAAGTYVGMIIEEKLSIGKVLVRIAIQKDSNKITKKLLSLNLPATLVNGTGKDGKVKIILSIIDKKELKKAMDAIKEINPKAFYTIEDIRFANDNRFPIEAPKKYFGIIRKGK